MKTLMDSSEDKSRAPLAAASLKDGSACDYVNLYLHLALGTAFLSAVADRFGLRGPAVAPHVAWGNFHNFLSYTGKLNPWFPANWIPTVGWLGTFCETIVSIALVLVKDSKRFADSGGWGYTVFEYDAASGTFQAWHLG